MQNLETGCPGQPPDIDADPPAAEPASRDWGRIVGRAMLLIAALLVTLAGLAMLLAGNVFCSWRSGPDSCGMERVIGATLLATAACSTMAAAGGRLGHAAALVATFVLACIAALSVFAIWQAGIADPYVRVDGAIRAAINSNALVALAALAIGWAGALVRFSRVTMPRRARVALVTLPVGLLLLPSLVAVAVARPVPIDARRSVVAPGYEALLPPGYAQGSGHYGSAMWLGIALHNSFYDNPIEMPPEVDLGDGAWYDDEGDGLFTIVNHVIGVHVVPWNGDLDTAAAAVRDWSELGEVAPTAEREATVDGYAALRSDYVISGRTRLALWSQGTRASVIVAVAGGRRYTITYLVDGELGRADEPVLRTFVEQFHTRA